MPRLIVSKTKSLPLSWLTLMAPATFFGVQCLRFAYLSRLPNREFVRYVPDNAFYYPCW